MDQCRVEIITQVYSTHAGETDVVISTLRYRQFWRNSPAAHNSIVDLLLAHYTLDFIVFALLIHLNEISIR